MLILIYSYTNQDSTLCIQSASLLCWDLMFILQPGGVPIVRISVTKYYYNTIECYLERYLYMTRLNST